MITKLNHVAPGQTVRVERIEGDGHLARRLVEMGIMRGVVLRVKRFAPLGDPMELCLKGCRISLRKKDASRISVEVVDTAFSGRSRRMRHRRGHDR